MTKVCRGLDSNTLPSACRANALTDYATAAAKCQMLGKFRCYKTIEITLKLQV